MRSCDYDDPADRPYGPTNPDYEYDAERDRDEGGKRNASGISAEELFLQDVHAEGAGVGYQGLSVNLNPFQSDSYAHDAWKRGWYAGTARRMSSSRLAA